MTRHKLDSSIRTVNDLVSKNDRSIVSCTAHTHIYKHRNKPKPMRAASRDCTASVLSHSSRGYGRGNNVYLKSVLEMLHIEYFVYQQAGISSSSH